MLTQIGYVPNIAQSDATLQGLRQLIIICRMRELLTW
ncbi:hypothetical protein ACUOA8_31115, partial [Escherichia sp. SS-MK2]